MNLQLLISVKVITAALICPFLTIVSKTGCKSKGGYNRYFSNKSMKDNVKGVVRSDESTEDFQLQLYGA